MPVRSRCCCVRAFHKYYTGRWSGYEYFFEFIKQFNNRFICVLKLVQNLPVFLCETQHMVNLGQKTAFFGHWYWAHNKKKPPKSGKSIMIPPNYQKNWPGKVDTQMVSRKLSYFQITTYNLDLRSQFKLLRNH